MEWLQVVLAPVLMVVGGIITWFIKSRQEELTAVEERLAEQRREVYASILEPYVELFANVSRGANLDGVTKTITSVDYRRTIFQLGLLGSDEVVMAYNNMMRYFFGLGSDGKPNMADMVQLWGNLRLEIRRSLGNKKTRLNAIDMLRGEITDIDKLPKSSSD